MNKLAEFYSSIVRPTVGLIAGFVFLYFSLTDKFPVEVVVAIIGVVIAFYFESSFSEKTINRLITSFESERSAHLKHHD